MTIECSCCGGNHMRSECQTLPPKSALETNVTINLPPQHQPVTPPRSASDNDLQYVTYDYEQPGPNGFWHIYSTDNDIQGTLNNGDAGTILYLDGPDTPEMHEVIKAIAKAIDAAVSIAEKIAGDR